MSISKMIGVERGLTLTVFGVIQGFFFVAEGGEISNLDLIKDINEIINLAEGFYISPDYSG